MNAARGRALRRMPLVAPHRHDPGAHICDERRVVEREPDQQRRELGRERGTAGEIEPLQLGRAGEAREEQAAIVQKTPPAAAKALRGRGRPS